MRNLYVLGIYYGYNECCINAFIQGNFAVKGTEFYGTGFVPCAECAKKEKTVVIDSIASRRICTLPFPETVALERVISDIEFALPTINETHRIMFMEFLIDTRRVDE